ncbi:hypothetical protein, partial [Pseudomonas syringae]|uniref:hypothetical protein n=1 Tax=Pseudomonas syringae TaxID=317 RepID=UPI001F1C6ADF
MRATLREANPKASEISARLGDCPCCAMRSRMKVRIALRRGGKLRLSEICIFFGILWVKQLGGFVSVSFTPPRAPETRMFLSAVLFLFK